MDFCKMIFGFFFIISYSLAQTIDFDNVTNWTSGGTGFNSYSSEHIYSTRINSHAAVFTGGPAMRQTTTLQDGVVGAYGTYSWRLANLDTVDWRVNLNLTSVDGFSFQVRRWDSSPSPNYNVEYSIDNGTSWVTVGLINNDFLDNSSKWKTFSYSTTIAGESNIILRLKANGTTERIMIDDFTFENPLPVQLTYFNGSLLNKEVVLSWQTATEINNYGFDVERRLLDSEALSFGNSSLKSKWETIGFVHGNGNSHSLKNYSFTDKLGNINNYLTGIVQYRLKQIDFDGQFEYSGIVDVNIDSAQQFKLEQNYPNPFNPETTISYKLAAVSNVDLKVYDMLGNEVATLVKQEQQPGIYNVKFIRNSVESNSSLLTRYSTLASGVYFYKLQTGNFTQVKKMILMK